MDHSIVFPEKLPDESDFLGLFGLIETAVHDVQLYKQMLVDKDQDYLLSMEQLLLNDNNNLMLDRDKALNKAKLKIVDQTLSTLHFISKYLEKASKLHKLLLESPNFVFSPDCIRLSFFSIKTRTYIVLFELLIRRCLNNCIDQLNSLDSGYKSPFDFSSTIEKLLKSLDNKLPVSTKQVESLLTLVQSELVIIKEIKTMNDGQRALITIYCDKLNLLESELSKVNKETENKPKQRCKKLRDIVDGIRLIIKDTFELVEVLESVNWINESDQIFNTINEKGIDAFDDLIDHMEKIRKEWIEKQTENKTQKVCRLAALRRINVHLKKIKKINSLKTELDSCQIILSIKRLASDFNQTKKSIGAIYNRAYYLTHGLNDRKPKIEVPDGFIRDDVIYDQLHSTSEYGILIVLVNLIEYLHYLNSLPWNKFQDRKPRKVCDCFIDFFDTMEAAIESCLNEDELQEISFDLADHLLLAKNKIATDRDALEYRLFRFKPTKPFKFGELQKTMKSQHHSRRYNVREYMEEYFDEMLDGLNRKVVNRGQVIIYKRAVDMMKRSLYTFRQMRTEYIRSNEKYLINLLVDQAANEYFYAAEIVVKLLDQFRSNRRIPFSFNADGPFTKQIALIGLKVKDEFEKEVDSLIEKLKLTIKEKEEDLEPIKEEKTQLRYLTSILKRSKLIPINELDLNEQDELIILKEIIEEYEYTMLTFGPVN